MMKKILAAVFALLLSFPALADQSSYQIPLTGPKAFGGSGGVADEISHAFLAAVGCSSGTAAPANGPSSAPILGQCWLNTTSSPNQVNIYDGTNWNPFFKVDPTNHANTLTVPFAVLGASTTILDPVNLGPRAEIDAGSSAAVLEINRYDNGAFPPRVAFAKSRGGIGANSAVVANDSLGAIAAAGADGSTYTTASQIQFVVDGTVSAGVVPTRIAIFTGSSGSGVEALRIDSKGYSTIGGVANQSTAQLEVDNNSSSPFNLSINNWSASNFVGGLAFQYSSSGTIGTQSLVTNGTELAQMYFQGSNGTSFQTAAEFFVEVDGTASASSMPGRFRFFTTPSGSLTPVEAVRINNNQDLMVNTTSDTDANGTVRLNVKGTTGHGAIDVTDGTVVGSLFISGAPLLEIGTVSNHAIAFFINNGSVNTALTTGKDWIFGYDNNATDNAKVNIYPVASSLGVAHYSSQSGHGTTSSNNCADCYDGIYTLNHIDVSSDDVNVPSGTGAGIAALSIGYKWGGSNAHGERSAIYVSTQWTANDATTSNPDGANNVGATIIAQSNINAGGGAAGSGRGGDWALNPKCLMGASSVNMSTCSGAEVNIEVLSGASVDNKIGWYVITTSGDAVQGRTINDAAYAFMTSGSVGFKCGYCASDLFTAKGPIATGGTFLGTEFASGPYTIAIGLDLTGFQNMTYQIKGKTFGVDGSGNMGAAAYVIVNGSLGVVATGVTCTAGTLNATTFTSNNGIVTHC